MDSMIVVIILVGASLLAGIILYRSMKASGGCACGCKSLGEDHKHAHDADSAHAGECCKK